MGASAPSRVSATSRITRPGDEAATSRSVRSAYDQSARVAVARARKELLPLAARVLLTAEGRVSKVNAHARARPEEAVVAAHLQLFAAQFERSAVGAAAREIRALVA